MCLVMVALSASFVMSSVYEMLSSLLRRLIFSAWMFLCSSALNAHVLHGYKKIDKTNAYSSFSLVDRLMFLSLHMGFGFASAAAVCAALVRTSLFVCLLVGCLTSQQQASVSQGRICSDNFTCCHTEIEAADQTFYLTQSQYTDTGPISPSADPRTPGAWQGSHWSANF